MEFDPTKCAVIVVDMQNDFGAPGGMFDRAGIDISGIVDAANATRPVLSAAREEGIPVIYLSGERGGRAGRFAPDLSLYGDVPLHQQSHGESFLALADNRFGCARPLHP